MNRKLTTYPRRKSPVPFIICVVLGLAIGLSVGWLSGHHRGVEDAQFTDGHVISAAKVAAEAQALAEIEGSRADGWEQQALDASASLDIMAGILDDERETVKQLESRITTMGYSPARSVVKAAFHIRPPVVVIKPKPKSPPIPPRLSRIETIRRKSVLTKADVRYVAAWACAKHGVRDVAWIQNALVDIIFIGRCESHGRAKARNGQHCGILQFNDGWGSVSLRLDPVWSIERLVRGYKRGGGRAFVRRHWASTWNR